MLAFLTLFNFQGTSRHATVFICYHNPFGLSRTIFESFGTAYVKEYALVKAFYLAVLLIDDVEDIREDIVAGRTTLISNYFKKMGIDLQTICPKSKEYWLDISAFLSPWLLKQLTKFSSFKETKIYRSLQSIYNHIQYKLKIE